VLEVEVRLILSRVQRFMNHWDRNETQTSSKFLYRFHLDNFPFSFFGACSSYPLKCAFHSL